MTTVADIYSAINELIPFDTKESWDNCGMLAGDPDKGVTKIITALDITNDVIEEAKASGAELIVSDHPVIFSPLKSVTGIVSRRQAAVRWSFNNLHPYPF